MRKSFTKATKASIGDHCVNCGATDGLQYHHIVPLAFGGNDTPNNMVCLCRRCHSLIHYRKDGSIDHGDAVRSGKQSAKKHERKHDLIYCHKTKVNEDNMRFIAEHSTLFVLESTMSELDIAEAMGLSYNTYSKNKKALFNAMNATHWPYQWEKPVLCRKLPRYTDVWERRYDGKCSPTSRLTLTSTR